MGNAQSLFGSTMYLSHFPSCRRDSPLAVIHERQTQIVSNSVSRQSPKHDGLGADGTRQPRIFLFSFAGCLSLQAGSSFVQFWPCLAEVALPLSTGSSARLGDGLAEACQRSVSSYDDGAADGTAGLAGIKVQALLRGESASSASVPARPADNGPGIHMAKIAVGA